MADELPLAVEIPWQIASTTQPLVAGEPDETAISLFTYRPDDAAITGAFPDHDVVFLKVATTITPAAFPPGTAPIAASALGEGIPCYHAQLDLRIRRGTGELGTIDPYFHSAAPLRREMLQTGLIGADAFSGESDHQFVGKSGSQMHESSLSRSATNSISGGAASSASASAPRRRAPASPARAM